MHAQRSDIYIQPTIPYAQILNSPTVSRTGSHRPNWRHSLKQLKQQKANLKQEPGELLGSYLHYRCSPFNWKIKCPKVVLDHRESVHHSLTGQTTVQGCVWSPKQMLKKKDHEKYVLSEAGKTFNRSFSSKWKASWFLIVLKIRRSRWRKCAQGNSALPDFFTIYHQWLNWHILTPEEGVNFQLHHLEYLYEKPDAKSSAEEKHFIIPLPCSLHSLIQPLQLRYYWETKKCNTFEEENRRQILESSRSCWDLFSPPTENPVFLTPQVRQMLCLFLQFQNNHRQLKLQDILSCCSSSPNQHKFSMNLVRWVWPSHINKVKDNPQRDCILCSLNRSSISTLLFNIKH